jgi:hypothetical protein
VVNVFAAAHGSRSRRADYRISFPSEARFFKRSIPGEVRNQPQDDFYRRIWAKYEELRDSRPKARCARAGDERRAGR